MLEFVRQLPFRPDLGNPDDGPRIQCDVSQRLRLSPALLKSGRNCVEGTGLFVTLAPLLAPERTFSSATADVDGQLHTFPIEYIDGRPVAIDIDPYQTVPPNVRNGALYARGKASPLVGGHLAPWFADLARNACISRNARGCYDVVTDSLCASILSGRRMARPRALDYLLSVSAADAQLFGPLGQVGYERMHNSIRNLSRSLDNDSVSKYLDKISNKVEPMAGDIIKAALIAQFGPVAAFALQGKKLGLGARTDKDKKNAQGVQSKGKRKPTREECRRRARRMSPAYFLDRR